MKCPSIGGQSVTRIYSKNGLIHSRHALMQLTQFWG